MAQRTATAKAENGSNGRSAHCTQQHSNTEHTATQSHSYSATQSHSYTRNTGRLVFDCFFCRFEVCSHQEGHKRQAAFPNERSIADMGEATVPEGDYHREAGHLQAMVGAGEGPR